MVYMLEINSIADKVRVARAAKNWTQGVVAMIAHVRQGQVSRLENGQPISDEDKAKILKAMDITEEAGEGDRHEDT